MSPIEIIPVTPTEAVISRADTDAGFTRPYASVDEMIADLSPTTGGDERRLLDWIIFASTYIDQRLGQFIPITETKCFDGNGKDRLFVPPVLAVIGIVDYENIYALSDIILYPQDRYWENGPYTEIAHDPDGEYAAWNERANSVAVSGRWGKYEKKVDAGEALGSTLTVDEKSLTASDGSKLSPGMVLLIDDEQMMVTATSDPSNLSALSDDLPATDEIVSLDDVSDVHAGEVIRIGFEKMCILDVNTTLKQISVLRQYHGTKQVAHSEDDVVEVYRTYSLKRGVNGTTATEHTTGTEIYRYLAPKPINELCRIIAGLIKNLTASAFAGRTGNADLGQVFYNDAFPRDADLAKYDEMYSVG